MNLKMNTLHLKTRVLFPIREDPNELLQSLINMKPDIDKEKMKFSTT